MREEDTKYVPEPHYEASNPGEPRKVSWLKKKALYDHQEDPRNLYEYQEDPIRYAPHRGFTPHNPDPPQAPPAQYDKPKVRGGKMPAPSVEKPTCPDHLTEMHHDPVKGVWVCPQYACTKKMRRRLNIGDASGQVIESDLHIYSTGTGDNEQYFLYVRQSNVFIDLTQVVSRDSTGTLHGSKTFMLAMEFPELHNRD